MLKATHIRAERMEFKKYTSPQLIKERLGLRLNLTIILFSNKNFAVSLIQNCNGISIMKFQERKRSIFD